MNHIERPRCAGGVTSNRDCDAWSFGGRVLNAVDRVLPRSQFRMTPTEYPMCSRAWSVDVFRGDQWVEVLGWGEYADWVLRGLGADPERHVGVGIGLGLERLAQVR